MEASHESTSQRARFRFRLRFVFLMAMACCLAVSAGPLAWKWAFPHTPQLPSPYTSDEDIQYFPPGPDFLLSTESAGVQPADDQSF